MTSAPSPVSGGAAPAAVDILFVDDDAILRTAFSELLRLQGFRVHAVPDGRKALEFLARQQPRLIITDIFMPNADGLELIMGLKQSWPPAGVLAISGGSFGPPELFLKTARLIGRARTLPKPFRPDELIDLVKEMLHAPAPPGGADAVLAGG
jgi:CheY-like chemotaxis protein